MKSLGLNIILHAHLPYVHHPEYEYIQEENWLFEALTECYLPLLAMLNRLQSDQIDYRLTLSLSPTLMTLWQDNVLKKRYQNYLLSRQKLIEAELERTAGQPQLQKIALHYRQQYQQAQQLYRQIDGDLLTAFKQHYLSGQLCLMTTAATHGFLPLLRQNQKAVIHQIQVGLETFNQYAGFRPKGFWLPECGYFAGLEQVLKDQGVEYFFVDSHAIEGASEKPTQGIYAPLDCGNGVKAFGRDPVASRQVWSAENGYPGDADYREFYRDIGFELPVDYLQRFLTVDDLPGATAIKYHRITGKTDDKLWYDPQQAAQKAQQHAEHFIQQRQLQSRQWQQSLDGHALVTVPFDAELLGHWWYEGPVWLEQVLRLAASGQYDVHCQSSEDYLVGQAVIQQALPADSSWGYQGFNRQWLNENNDWIYPYLHQAAEDMEKLMQDLKTMQLTELQSRAVNQAMRSLLLAQASDWSFILTAGTTCEYANRQLEDHLARFQYLLDGLRKNRLDEKYVAALEIMDDIFPALDFRRLD
jgi:1,4-alpha-glucan branching enzyme